MADLELIEHRLDASRAAILVLQQEVTRDPSLNGVANRMTAAALQALFETVTSLTDYLRSQEGRANVVE
ncbi:hypothetical protein PQI23_13650 [Leucobacter sp. USCH14]|uniref:hypothetical protein n=1 Tax=Leucobacter sp. USCH14 TaxID=3024838 RepID=UPI00309B2664